MLTTFHNYTSCYQNTPKPLIIGISCWDFLPDIALPPPSKGALEQAFGLLC